MTTKVHPLAPFLASLARFASGVRPVWRGPLPDSTPRIYFANHTSHLDAVVLWATLPQAVRRHTRPVAARDYWERGKTRRFLATEVARAVLVDRGPAEVADPAEAAARREAAVAVMLQVLDDGDSLILFPEGTRGQGETVGRFRSGLWQIAAARPEVVLVPVYLENLNRILPKGEVLPLPLLSRAIFGAPLERVGGEGRAEFLVRAQAAVAGLAETPPPGMA